MGYKQVQLAVVVVVEPNRAAREAAAAYFRAGGYVGESAVAKIPEQVVRSHGGDVDVVLAVVVIVTDRTAHAIHLDRQPRLFGAVSKGSISVVVVKGGVVFGGTM